MIERGVYTGWALTAKGRVQHFFTGGRSLCKTRTDENIFRFAGGMGKCKPCMALAKDFEHRDKIGEPQNG